MAAGEAAAAIRAASVWESTGGSFKDRSVVFLILFFFFFFFFLFFTHVLISFLHLPTTTTTSRLPDGFTQLLNLTQLFLNDAFLEYLPANFGR